MFEHFEANAHFADASDGEKRIVAAGHGMASEMAVCLNTAVHPVHMTELLDHFLAKGLIEDREYNTVNMMRKLVTDAGGLVFARSVYGLPHHVPLSEQEQEDITGELRDILQSEPRARQWHSEELLTLLHERRTDTPAVLDGYMVSVLLHGADCAKYVGRQCWTTAASGSPREDRLAIADLCERELEKAGKPLTTRQLQVAIAAQRGLGAHFMPQPTTRMVRLSRGMWGLMERDIQWPAEDRESALDCLHRILGERQKGLHQSELTSAFWRAQCGSPSEVDPDLLLMLAQRDERFRVSKGDLVGLGEWEGVRRLTLQVALRRIKEEFVGPWSDQELGRLVRQLLDRDFPSQSLRPEAIQAGFRYDEQRARWLIAEPAMDVDEEGNDYPAPDPRVGSEDARSPLASSHGQSRDEAIEDGRTPAPSLRSRRSGPNDSQPSTLLDLTPMDTSIHEELSALVARTNLPRSEFGRRLGVSAPQISNWLNGRTPIPAHRVEEMRRVLSQLLGEASIERTSYDAMTERGDDSADWRFIFANVNAGKDFGNAGIYATPQSIPSLVRETGQNSLDASIDSRVTVRYTLFELSPSSRRYQRFLSAMRLRESLGEHVKAAAASGGGQNKIGLRLKAALRALEDGEPLRLMRIEDFGTRGLPGDEHDSKMPFCALVRDNLNSQKQQATAGGVFGIGSKTLWSCSRMSTVLFASDVFDEKQGDSRIRVIGKSDLAYHEDAEGSSFAGAGWFGAPVGADGAESLWLNTEDTLLEDLLLARTPPPGEERSTGTSALILSFYDPKADDEAGAEIAQRFVGALAENFWPAMVAKQLSAYVDYIVNDEDRPRTSMEVIPSDHMFAFADALAKHEAGSVVDALVNPGDVVSVPIRLSVPATKPSGGLTPQHAEIEAECRLIIRLADTTANKDWIDHVGFARGRAMIVKYERKSGVVMGARPFHAFLLAGTLAGKGVHEQYAERFLRHAEPTAHDDWSLNGDLKERYAHGAGARLRAMYQDVIAALQKYLKTQSEASNEGPELLREQFSIRTTQRPESKPKVALRNVIAVPNGEGWNVQGEIVISVDAETVVEPRVTIDPESGRGVDLVWETLISPNGSVDGSNIAVPAGTRLVRFSGTTRPVKALASKRCVLRVNALLVRTGAAS